MTLKDDFLDVINSLEDSIQDMGVSDAEFDSTTGIMGLVDRILDISPSLGGINVITKLSVNLSKTNIIYGDSIVISGVLEADKDDTSSTNVDLEGYLKGATIKVYRGETLLGTAITNSDGEYSFNYNNITMLGANNIHCVFEGTNDYQECTSISIPLTVNNDLIVTATEDILSFADNDITTLTATLIGKPEYTSVTYAYTDRIRSHELNGIFDITLSANSGVDVFDKSGSYILSIDDDGDMTVRGTDGTFVGPYAWYSFVPQTPLHINTETSEISFYDQESSNEWVTRQLPFSPTLWGLNGGSFTVTPSTPVIFKSDVLKSTTIANTGSYDLMDSMSIDLSNISSLTIGDTSSSYIGITMNNDDYVIQMNGNQYVATEPYIKICEEKVLKYINNNDELELNIPNDIDFSLWSIGNGDSVLIDEYFYKTGVLDRNNECSVTYNSQGIGDVNINVECMNLQKTYSIEDCTY